MKWNSSVRRARHVLTAWIACFAILLSSLAPSISHALAATNNAGNVITEVCTSTGLKLVDKVGVPFLNASLKSSLPADSKMMKSGHCPYCLPRAGSLGMPPVVTLTLPPAVAAQSFPSLSYLAPRPLFTWTSARSRAPPLAS
ncbi:hypothetical protein BH11PSE11_BH11PSE11_10550 [soil metagenome]